MMEKNRKSGPEPVTKEKIICCRGRKKVMMEDKDGLPEVKSVQVLVQAQIKEPVVWMPDLLEQVADVTEDYIRKYPDAGSYLED